MLYLFLGTDIKKINSFVEERSDGMPMQKLDVSSWDAQLARGFIESNSLFGVDNEGLVLDGIGENDEAYALLMTFTAAMVESEKKFFVIESDISEETMEFLKNKGAKISDFRGKPEKIDKKINKWSMSAGRESYNPFALADAVGKKSAKESWIEYERARIAGASPEELHSRVWSKARDMISSGAATSKELGIHPFVHKKAKADMKNWSPRLLQNFADDLVGAYHKSRLGGDTLDIAIEKILLSI